MKAISAKGTSALNLGALLVAADNSGAKIVKLVSVKKWKGRKNKQACAKIADWVKVSVRKGIPEMRGKVFDAVVVRLKDLTKETLEKQLCSKRMQLQFLKMKKEILKVQ